MKKIKVVCRYSTEDPDCMGDVCEVVVYDEVGWPILSSDDPDSYELGIARGFVLGLQKAYPKMEVTEEERADYLC